MNIAIVLAGGIGSRVGAAIPKQFIEVLEKPIMTYTLDTFQKAANIDEIVLVMQEKYIDLGRMYCKKYKITKVKSIVPGGKEFINSCINGVYSLTDKCAYDDIVVITSADRPFITKEEIDDSIRVCGVYGSGVAARPCSLCMFVVDEENKTSSDVYMREKLVQTATPWTFRYGEIRDALERYEAGAFPGCEPYPVAIYAASGKRVHFSKAYPGNIKITEKTDIKLMEQILLEKAKEADNSDEC